MERHRRCCCVLVFLLCATLRTAAAQFPGMASDALFHVDDRTWQLISDGDASIEKGDGLAAIRSWQRVLDRRADVFVRSRRGQPLISAHLAVEERLLRSGPPVRQQYEAVFGPLAEQELQAAAPGDEAVLLGVATRYRCTLAGSRALLSLARRYFDRGEWRLAKAAADLFRADRQLATELLPSTQRFMDLVSAQTDLDEDNLAIGNFAGSPRDSSERSPRSPAAFPDAEDGHDVARTPSLRPARVDWTEIGAGPDRNSWQSAPLPLLDAIWQSPRARASESFQDQERTWQQIFGQLAGSRDGPVVGAQLPLIVGRIAVRRELAGLVAYSLTDGAVEWTFPLQTRWEDLLAGSIQALGSWGRDHQGSARRQLMAAAFQGRIADNALSGLISSDGRRIFCLDQFYIAGETPNRTDLTQPDREGVTASRANQLVAIELTADRRPKIGWRAGGVTGSSGLAGHFFLGPPTALSSRLLVLSERNRDSLLNCLDSQTGVLLWSQPLVATEQLRRPAFSTWTQVRLVSAAGGVAIASPAPNILMGVDSLRGRLLWGHMEARTQRGGFGGRRAGWDQERGANPFEQLAEGRSPLGPMVPVLASGRMIYTPEEGGDVVALDLTNGAPVWRMGRSPGSIIAGIVRGQVMVVALRDVRGIPLAAGPPESWSLTLPGGVVGRPVCLGEYCVLPLEGQRLGWLHVPSRRLTVVDLPGELPALGHLVAGRGVLLSAGWDALTSWRLGFGTDVLPLSPGQILGGRESATKTQSIQRQEERISAAERAWLAGDLETAAEQLQELAADRVVDGRTSQLEWLLTCDRARQQGGVISIPPRQFNQLSSDRKLAWACLNGDREQVLQWLESTLAHSTGRSADPNERLRSQLTRHPMVPAWRLSAEALRADLLAPESRIDFAASSVPRSEPTPPKNLVPLDHANRNLNAPDEMLSAGQWQQRELHLLSELERVEVRDRPDVMSRLATLYRRGGLASDAELMDRAAFQMSERFPLPGRPVSMVADGATPPLVRAAISVTPRDSAVVHVPPVAKHGIRQTLEAISALAPDRFGAMFWEGQKVDWTRGTAVSTRLSLQRPIMTWSELDTNFCWFVLDRTSGQPRWDWKLGPDVTLRRADQRVQYPSVALVGHCLLVAGAGRLQAWSEFSTSPEPIWEVDLSRLQERRAAQSIASAGPEVVVLQARNRLTGVATDDGRILWERDDVEPRSGVESQPQTAEPASFGDHRVLVLQDAGRRSFRVYRTGSGRLMSKVDAPHDQDLFRMAVGSRLFCQVPDRRQEYLIYDFARPESEPWTAPRVWDRAATRISETEVAVLLPAGTVVSGPLTLPSRETAEESPQKVDLVQPGDSVERARNDRMYGEIVIIDLAMFRAEVVAPLSPADLDRLQGIDVWRDGDLVLVNVRRDARNGARSPTDQAPVPNCWLPAVDLRGSEADELYGFLPATRECLWRRAIRPGTMLKVWPLELPVLVHLSQQENRRLNEANTLSIDLLDRRTGWSIGKRTGIPWRSDDVDHTDVLCGVCLDPLTGRVSLTGSRSIIEVDFAARQQLDRDPLAAGFDH